MKKIFLLCLLSASPLFAQTAVTVIARQYVEREKSFLDRPYGEDDLSYGLYLDMFDGIGGWRLGASYATDLTGLGSVDTVITPEITLIGREGIWESGISVMMDYVDDGVDTDWGDVYYQFQLGLGFPLGNHLDFGIAAYFPFTDFGDFTDLRFSEMDLGLTLRGRF
ncbi:MAG: hypothetical protein ACO3N7_06495 [Kiritimatiellia bacterium]